MLESFHHELNESGSVRFIVRAVPNAPETRIIEVMEDESLKIAIAAPADKGKANRELITFLAREFGVAKPGVEILSGETSRMKIMRVKK